MIENSFYKSLNAASALKWQMTKLHLLPTAAD
jgi:hypothetical protein